jgi:hypothetical protein
VSWGVHLRCSGPELHRQVAVLGVAAWVPVLGGAGGMDQVRLLAACTRCSTVPAVLACISSSAGMHQFQCWHASVPVLAAVPLLPECAAF